MTNLGNTGIKVDENIQNNNIDFVKKQSLTEEVIQYKDVNFVFFWKYHYLFLYFKPVGTSMEALCMPNMNM